MSSHKAKELCPELEMINGDPRKYSEMTDRFQNILSRWATNMSSTSIDEVYLDVTEAAEDWLGAFGIALQIRKAIRQEIGSFVTVSIGIAANMLMAKVASNSEKPNGLTIIYHGEEEAFLDTRELIDIPGIGPRLEARLHALGIQSVPELRSCPLSWLTAQFKQYGSFLYTAARGQGSTVFTPKEAAKSIGHCYTLPFDTTNPRRLRGTLSRLADKVGWRLRSHQLAARRYTAVARFQNKRFTSQQGRLDAPTQDGLDLLRAAWSHIERFSHTNHIRLVGVVAHDLVPAHRQISLDKQKQKRTQLLDSLDVIQHRWGKNSWFRPVQMGAPLKERSSGFHFDHKV